MRGSLGSLEEECNDRGSCGGGGELHGSPSAALRAGFRFAQDDNDELMTVLSG